MYSGLGQPFKGRGLKSEEAAAILRTLGLQRYRVPAYGKVYHVGIRTYLVRPLIGFRTLPPWSTRLGASHVVVVDLTEEPQTAAAIEAWRAIPEPDFVEILKQSAVKTFKDIGEISKRTFNWLPWVLVPLGVIAASGALRR